MTAEPNVADLVPEQLRRQLLDDLGLDPRNPVAEVKRWGAHEDSRLVITLRDGTRIVFDRARDVFEAPIVRRRVALATNGAAVPNPKAKAVEVAVRIIRLASIEQAADDRDEAAAWADDFLEAHARTVVDVATFSSAAGKREVLSAIRSGRSVVRVADTGDLYVSVSPFGAHVRSVFGVQISWSALHSRMVEIGWDHLGQVAQRSGIGAGILKARLYRVPPAAEAG